MHPKSSTFLPHWLNALVFYGLTFALLVPLWTYRYFPSQDGPLHRYNAGVLHDYDHADRPAFRDYFVPNTALVPNWLCPHLLPAMLNFFSANIAEKILLSVYLILFPISVRYALGAVHRRGRFLSLAVLPMVPNQFYHMGFEDFCFGLAGYFFIVGYFLRRRRNFGPVHAMILAAMLLALYITHLIPLVMVLPLIGFTALSTSCMGSGPVITRMRKSIPVIAAMLPVVLLTAYFSLRPHQNANFTVWPHGWSHRLFLIVLWMKSYQYYEAAAGVAMLLLLAGGTIWLLHRDRRRATLPGASGGLLATVMFYSVLFLVAPDSFAGAQVLLVRVVAFVFLAVLLWWATLPMGPRTFARLELIVALISVPTAIGLLACHLKSYTELNRYLVEFEAIAPEIPAGATLAPVLYNDSQTWSIPSADGSPRHRLSTGIDPFHHAASINLAEGGIIDLGNIWAVVDHQSLRWRSGLDPLKVDRDHLEDFVAYAARTGRPVDYVVIWTGGISHDDPEARRIDQALARGYNLAYTSPVTGYLKLYRRSR